MTPALVDAVASLVAEGRDTETVSSLLLNGAAALVLERCTEAEFAERARSMWRTAARQVELVALLDRVTQRRGLFVKPKRQEFEPSAVSRQPSAQRGSGSRSEPQAASRKPRAESRSSSLGASSCPRHRTLREGETS